MALRPKSIYGIVAAILCIAVLSLSGALLTKADGDNWTAHSDISWYDSVYPSYSIRTPEQLAGVAKLVNEGTVNGFSGKILDIENDLDLSAYNWVPIGTPENPFRGALLAKNGATFTISGMRLSGDLTYSGLVGYMDEATVGGFTFDRGSIHIESVTGDVYAGASAKYAGSAVGKMVNNSIVYGITNHVPIQVDTLTPDAAVGGIVGSGEGIISSSVNHASVTVSGTKVYTGGIAGYADNNGLKIKKVENNGAVHARSGAGDVYAAGILGYASGAVRMDEESTPISNNAAVTAERGSNNFAGGIVGKASADITFSANTSNNGTVNVEAPQANSSYAGGLIGAIGIEQTYRQFDVAFTSTKPITNNGGTNVYTGGIAGFINSNFTWGKNFVNNVNITATGTEHVYTGGAIGGTSGKLQFNGSVKNTGAVNVTGGGQPQKPDDAYTGGLIGYAADKVLFQSETANAYENSGTISVSGGNGLYTGGIIANRVYARAPKKEDNTEELSDTEEASTNVNSTGNLTVSGVSKLYTGGFIGIIPDEGIYKTISKATFASQITVAATASDPDRKVSTGGIVGYYVNRSGSGTISDAAFKGKISAIGGGSETYTGGIVGYMDGGTAVRVSTGNQIEDFATIAADGTLGGIAGFAKGTIDTASVIHSGLTIRTTNGIAGGVAGQAQGAITGAVVGDANFASNRSMTIEATADRITAGGIIGRNTDALTIVGSTAVKVGLISESARSGYTMGAIAGELTADARIGEAESPLTVRQITIDIKAQNSNVGGAIGINRSPAAYVKAEHITLNILGAQAKAGAIAGVNHVETEPAKTADYALAATSISVSAQGNDAYIGGIYGENVKASAKVQAEQMTITASGSSNQIGGITGRNTGTLTDSKAENLSVEFTGAGTAVGGIAGRSEMAAGSETFASIANPSVLALDAPLITAKGSNGTIGGIVGFAIATKITSPAVSAVLPDYALLSLQADSVTAGGIAGRIENGSIAGDASKTNAVNVMIAAGAAATNAYAGGIAGYNEQTRLNDIVASNVNLIMNGQRTTAGGIAGYNHGTATAIIVNSYVEALNIKVNASAASSTVGGFVGVNDARAGDPSPNPASAISTIQTSRIVGSVNIASPSTVTGGMVGENRSLIANNSISDKIPVISRGNDGTLGGLVGLNTSAGTLYYTYSNVNLTIEGQGTTAGGLVGENRGQVISSYVDIDIAGNASGTNNSSVYLGGLVGRNIGTIEKSYTNSKVTAGGVYTNVGGLVGEHAAGSIANSYAAKEVVANNGNSYAGGLLGRIVAGKVTTVYSAGQVTGTNGAYAGGFAGRYDNASKELIYKAFYVKDENAGINKDLPDFAEGNHRWLNVNIRLSTILSSTLQNREIYPGLSGWDFTGTWKYGSPNAEFKYPELIRSANTGGDGGSGHEVNANINWYMRDKDAIIFEVKSEAELAGLAAIVNGTVTGVPKFSFEGRTIRVTNPIHIQSKQWVPIGNNVDNAFQGAFIGNDYLIDGLSVQADQSYSGLFGVIGEQGKVEQIKLEPLSVAGSQYTGVLAGINKGAVTKIDIKLTNGAKVSGTIVGSLIGQNTGTFTGVSITLDGGSRVESAADHAIIGGMVGDNSSAIDAGKYNFKVLDGSISSSGSNATIGGLIGKQTGDVSGLKSDIAAYRISSAGVNTVAGGLIGHQRSGKTEHISVTFIDGTLETLGTGSVLGGVIGQSDADNTISNVTVTAAQEGRQHMTGTGMIGGVVGTKEGKGDHTFDIDHVKVEKLLLSSVDGSGQAVMGGIAGKLTNTAVHHSAFAASIYASADNVTVGGIVGLAYDSIFYRADVAPDITVKANAGEVAAGGVAGIIESGNVNQAFDFGNWIPFYRGIYDATVHSKEIKVSGADSGANLYTGGIAGKNIAASIYHTNVLSSLLVDGGRITAVGGIAGFSDGIIVGSAVSAHINAERSSVYQVGGVVGRATGGEIHYSNSRSTPEGISVGSAVTRPDMMPATHVGGFVGMADDTKITNSYADVPVQIDCINQENTIYAGGFAGLLGDSATTQGLIERAYAKGGLQVQGKTSVFVGGFAGSVDNYRIVDAYATGNVINAGFDTRSGGFTGALERHGSIQHAYAVQEKISTTGINHATRSYTGGFVGYNDGMLEDIFASTSEMIVNASGANVYKGALIGYNFRDGKTVRATYRGAMGAVGRNAGSPIDAVAIQEDMRDSFGFGSWQFEQDATFLAGGGSAEAVILNAKQLRSAVLLANSTGLEYYKLFNRAAVEKLNINKLSLAADIDLGGASWTPFEQFHGELDGGGHTITGLKNADDRESNYGFISDNHGRVHHIVFEDVFLSAGNRTGIVAGINHAGGTISDIAVRGGSVKGRDYAGGAAGENKGTISNVQLLDLKVEGVNYIGGLTGHNSGTVDDISVNGTINGSGSFVGGAAGANAGRIAKTHSAVSIYLANSGQVTAAGGIAGANEPTGQIARSFSYSDLDAAADQVMVGGIAGINHGRIDTVYNSGRVKASGAVKAWAGGLVGYAVEGTISYSLNYGEAVADVNGLIVRNASYFGGIAGQKEQVSSIHHTAFDKQMLKTNTAYYDVSGNRIAGDDEKALGMLTKELTEELTEELTNGTLLNLLDTSQWKSVVGYYPQLADFYGTDVSKLSAAAVVWHEKDSVNRIKAPFGLTPDRAIAWTANPGEISIVSAIGTLKTTGSAMLTAAVNGLTRNIVIHTPALKYKAIASKPKVVSGETTFTNQVFVVLATDEPGGSIYYTLDGKQPDAESLLYKEPIVLNNTTTLKAVTIADEKEMSEPLSGAWTKKVVYGGGGFIPAIPAPPAVTPNIGQGTVNGDSGAPIAVAKNSKLKLTAPEGQIIYYTTDGSAPTKNSPRFQGELLITGNMIIKAITDKDDRVVTISYQVENAKYQLKSDAGHIKYVQGFEDGTFKPDAAITRYDLIHVLNPLLSKEEANVGNLFHDVKNGIAESVAFFASAGIIEGYPDGTFGGEGKLTRAEFVAMMARVLKLDITNNGEAILSDVKGHWAEKYINAFTAAGYVDGFPDGTFQPDSEISRAQVVVLVNRAIGTSTKQGPQEKFSDVASTHWAYDHIMSVAQ